MAMNKDMQDINLRHSIVKYAKRFGVTKASRQFRVSRTLIYKLLSRFDGNINSLAPRSKRPKSHPRESTKEEYSLIRNYHKRNPNMGLVILWVKLRKAGYTRCITTLYRSLIRLGLRTNPPKKIKYKPKPYEQMTFPGERIQIDVKYVPVSCMTNGKKYYQYTCIDEYTRFRYLEVYKEKSTYSSKCFIEKCVAKLPFQIKTVQTDNGLEFTNKLITGNTLPTLFETTLERLGIKHKLIKPYTPRHNGKVERSHGKDTLYFYNKRSFYSFEDLQNQIRKYTNEYNNFPMKPLGYLSPKEFLDKYNTTAR